MIIVRLQAGDMKALEELYDILHERLYSFVFRIIRNQELAKDIVQSTFIKVWENRTKISIEKPLDAQVYVIAKNLLLNNIKRQNIEQQVIERLSYEESHLKDGFHSVQFNETYEFFEKAIEQLPHRRRLIYKLSNIDGLSNKEIAQRLSISNNTVENHLTKANYFIRQNLQFLKETVIIFFLFSGFKL